mgnify:CR=1 FL=1
MQRRLPDPQQVEREHHQRNRKHRNNRKNPFPIHSNLLLLPIRLHPAGCREFAALHAQLPKPQFGIGAQAPPAPQAVKASGKRHGTKPEQHAGRRPVVRSLRKDDRRHNDAYDKRQAQQHQPRIAPPLPGTLAPVIRIYIADSQQYTRRQQHPANPQGQHVGAQQQKKEQLAALTHDIKTPLTVIKGNAELLAETDLSAENRECTDAILANVGSMEQYLEHMRQLLYGRDRAEETEVVTCARLKEQFKEAAMQIADEFGIIYDNSVRSPPKPVRREKSPMQILEETKTKTYRVLSDYLHLLKEWERNFRPESIEKIDERYVEAVQNREKVEFQLDTLLWGTEDEKEAVIHDLGKGVEDIERRVREYRRNQGAVNHNRQRSCEAVH